jgi:hypothetical protein
MLPLNTHSLFRKKKKRMSVLLAVLGLLATAGAACRNELACRPVAATHGLVIYNRIPKTGSASLRIAMAAVGEPRGVRVFTSEGFFLEARPADAPRETGRSTRVWTDLHAAAAAAAAAAAPAPVLYNNHMYYANVTAPAFVLPGSEGSGLGPLPPALHGHVYYVNQVRDPVDRFISRYYFDMHGRRPQLLIDAARRANMAATGLNRPASVDEWLQLGPLREIAAAAAAVDAPGSPLGNSAHCVASLNVLTAYFCGLTDPVCNDVCSMGAQQRAWTTARTAYMVVGALEDWQLSMRLYEHLLPAWFTGLAAAAAAADAPRYNDLRNTTAAYAPPAPLSRVALAAMMAPDVRLHRRLRALLAARAHCCNLTP